MDRDGNTPGDLYVSLWSLSKKAKKTKQTKTNKNKNPTNKQTNNKQTKKSRKTTNQNPGTIIISLNY